MVASAIKYDQYKLLDLGEKIDWIDTITCDQLIAGSTRLQIKNFFKAVYNGEVNNYLRRKAVEYVAELTLLDVIRYEYTKDFLLEEVGLTDDSFIVSTKLKYLFLLFGDDQDVYNELNRAAQSELFEVAAEANYRLGLIHLLYRAGKNGSDDMVRELDAARTHFRLADAISENRIDAQFFEAFIDYILALLGGTFGDSQTDYRRLLQLMWQREVWGWLPGTELLEYQILQGLKNLNQIASTVTQEPAWTEYKKELLVLNKPFNDLILNRSLNKRFIKSYEGFTENIATKLVTQYYVSNLSACTVKIDALIQNAGPEEKSFTAFLIDLKERLQAHEAVKSTDNSSIIARLYHAFPKLDAEKIGYDVKELSNQGEVENDIVASLALRYAIDQNFNRVDFLTGYKAADEVLRPIMYQIKKLLPKYPADKLSVSMSILSDLIRYQYQSLIMDKPFFAPLYDSSIKAEKVFQGHLFNRLTSSSRASYYSYEETGTVGASRIDIIYRELELTFPIEVKKTEVKPTWETIKKDYLAQVQTYVHPYNQVGFLVVFDISEKKGKGPINDFRSLSEILHLAPYYSVPDVYPDYVITLVIPGNKISPSNYSKYSK